MSSGTLRSGAPKRGPPAHQNSFAFKHNKGSKKTAVIREIVHGLLCERCRAKIEWRKKYRKYVPLKAPAVCNACHEKTVKRAYHTLCNACAGARGACAKCVQPLPAEDAGEPAAVPKPKPPSEEELAMMRERERRTAIRQYQRQRAEARGAGQGAAGAGAGAGERESVDGMEEDDEEAGKRRPSAAGGAEGAAKPASATSAGAARAAAPTRRTAVDDDDMDDEDDDDLDDDDDDDEAEDEDKNESL